MEAISHLPTNFCPPPSLMNLLIIFSYKFNTTLGCFSSHIEQKGLGLPQLGLESLSLLKGLYF